MSPRYSKPVIKKRELKRALKEAKEVKLGANKN
jgi:hypothetical protein